MAPIEKTTGVIEEFEALIEARAALAQGDLEHVAGISDEIASELLSEYGQNIQKKVERWIEATHIHYFYEKGPPRFYMQTKMLYRDGYHEATIMLSRSIAEMVCYDRLDGVSHPFGSVQDTEKTNFRKLLNWLIANDTDMAGKAGQNLHEVYDIGNNYVHPKSGQSPSTDSKKCINLLGESLFLVYGVKRPDDLIGRQVRSAYLDFPDINSGLNFNPTAFSTPAAAIAHASRHRRHQAKKQRTEKAPKKR